MWRMHSDYIVNTANLGQVLESVPDPAVWRTVDAPGDVEKKTWRSEAVSSWSFKQLSDLSLYANGPVALPLINGAVTELSMNFHCACAGTFFYATSISLLPTRKIVFIFLFFSKWWHIALIDCLKADVLFVMTNQSPAAELRLNAISNCGQCSQ